MGGVLLKLQARDTQALNFLVCRRRRGVDPLMRGVTHLGDAAVVLGVTLLLLLSGVPELHGAGRLALAALAGSHALVQLLKRTVSRPRPQLPVGTASLVAAPDRFSFPSGHAAAALSLALAGVPLLGTAAAACLLLLALLVGVSRCYLGVHYPGDVLAGWLLAVLGVGVAGALL